MGRNILYLTILVLYPSYGISDPLRVDTESGRLRGRLVEHDEVRYLSFQGIPYAEPPVGELRFKEAPPKKPWSRELDATKEGNVCYQTPSKSLTSQLSEDCLFLNIYNPISNTSSPKPVMVWIHGGEFKALSGNENLYGPHYFMIRDIIVVTMNYRLGALGFLSLGTEKAPGNQGLKDVLLGLKWIKTNIKYFGGDDTKITLAGQSAGSAIVHYMLLTEKTTGFFRNAILQSGSAIGYRFFTNTSRDEAYQLAETAGAQTSDEDELLLYLQVVHPADIVKAQEDMGRCDKRKGFRPFTPFVPTIEKEGSDAFITQLPSEIVKNNIPQNVPLIVGFNKREGLKAVPVIRANPIFVDYLNEDFQRCVPTDFVLEDGDPVKKDLAADIANFYFGDGEINNQTIDGFIDLITDTQFAYSIHNWLRLHKAWGAAHSDELGYIFRSVVTEPYIDNASKDTNYVKNNLGDMWANFVKFGLPTPNADSPIMWQPTVYPDMNHLVIDDALYIKQRIPRKFRDRIEFWDSLYK